MRNDCKHSYSCKVRVLSAEFAKLSGIDLKGTPCCVSCEYFVPNNKTEEKEKDE